jgi:hypothetical protein
MFEITTQKRKIDGGDRRILSCTARYQRRMMLAFVDRLTARSSKLFEFDRQQGELVISAAPSLILV